MRMRWLLVLVLVVVMARAASSDSTTFPCNAASGTSWTNPTNVLAIGGGSAVATNTNALSVTSCGADNGGTGTAVPSDGIIDGIQVRYIGCGTSNTANNRRITLNLLNLGTCTAKANNAQAKCATTTDATIPAAGNDLWSCNGTITPTTINAAAFGATLTATTTDEHDEDFLSIIVTFHTTTTTTTTTTLAADARPRRLFNQG